MNYTLYPNSTVDRLLGSLVQNTQLCVNPRYPLKKENFLREFHKIIFVALQNLATEGTERATIADIGEYVSQWDYAYEVLEENNFMQYIEDITDENMTNSSNFESYYNQFRKYGCLRDYRDQGFDISLFYDEKKDEESQIQNLAKYSMKDIVDHFGKLQSGLRREYITGDEITSHVCGNGWAEYLERRKEDPMVGSQLAQPIVNNLFRGWCRGHLILCGAPSSFGKTLLGAMHLVYSCSLKIWSKEKKCFIENPYYKGKGALIHSEQKSEDEIQPRIISVLSGVEYYKILDGKFTQEEEERLLEAGRIIEESELLIKNYPKFTATGIEQEIETLANEGYEYIVQDYVWNNSYIISDMKKTLGITNVSEPNALLHFVNALKLSAEKYNVAVYTSMQLNDSYKTAPILDEGCLYASKAVKTKLDNGMIATTPRDKDMKQIEGLITQWNKKNNTEFGNRIIPNMLSSCFKTRYGRFGENVRVWSYIDKGTGEIIDMFATKHDNTPIDIQPLYIESK